MSFTSKGFTLIELLIVVAIIAILAAIAIPNFLAAQVRAKMARTLAQFQTSATALESYAVDYNTYPAYNNPMDDPPHTGDNFMPLTLTTPVAYITSLWNDTFPSQNEVVSHGDFHPYHYKLYDQDTDYVWDAWAGQHSLPFTPEQDINAKWLVGSHGPCLKDLDFVIAYDPTNGIVSDGNPVRFGP